MTKLRPKKFLAIEIGDHFFLLFFSGESIFGGGWRFFVNEDMHFLEIFIFREARKGYRMLMIVQTSFSSIRLGI